MPRPPTLAILLVLLLAPTAQAGLFDREVVIRVATEREGDRMSYEIARTAPQIDVAKPEAGPRRDVSENVQRVVLVEGAARAIDAFGIERETIAYRVDLASDDTVHWAVRCHRLAGGSATVRTDHLGATRTEVEATTTGTSRATMDVQPTSDFTSGPCVPGVVLGGRELRAGDQLPIEAIDSEYAHAPGLAGAMSEPAEPITFQERPALAFRFASEEGTLEYILADGLPAYAQRTLRVADESGEGFGETATLVGYAPGEGVAIAAAGSATLPARNPNAAFAAPDPLALDDEAYELAFPYADAYAAILADPTTRFSEWLAAHPDAILAYAMYARGGSDGGPIGLSTRGAWDLGFTDGNEGVSFHVVRADGATTPLGPIAAPATSDRVTGQSEYSADRASTLPEEIADSASLAELARAHGIDPRDLSALQYVAQDPPFLQLTHGENEDESTHLVVDPTRAAAVSSYTMRYERGLLGFFTGGVQGDARGGFSAIMPPSTLATGAAAATGVGLLLLLLLPLFTRLRRDRLLDNPVRARLYERIRAEPGLHRAELVDFAGIGEGATRHHLSQLASHRLVVETAQDGFVRYFAAGEVPPAVARREALLRAGSHRAVYELYASEPTISLREAGARLGMSAPSVHRAKKKLEHAGLLPAAPDASEAVAEA